MSVTDARTVMTRRLGKVESHFICKLAIGLFQISVLLILGMAIIEVTVEADHLTGQVSFNFPVVCKSVNVKSAKLLNVCVSYICFTDHRS